MNSREYWAAAKKAAKIDSDYGMAARLEITRASASLLANGHSIMSNTTAAKVAEILEISPLKVIADLELERGTNNELWKRIAKKVALVSVCAVGLTAVPSPAPAAQGLGTTVYYVKSRRRPASGFSDTLQRLVRGLYPRPRFA